MSLQRIALFCALSVSALYSQNNNQVALVKEVDGFARASFRGHCITLLNVGQQSSGFDQCSLRTTAGVWLGSRVPDKKILVLEDVSARCNRGSQDSFAEISVGNADVPLRMIPVTSWGAIIGGLMRTAGFTSGRTYFMPGELFGNRITMAAPPVAQVNCQLLVTGYFVDVP